jgi:hypothetical protein
MSQIVLIRYAYLPDATLGRITHTADGELIEPVLWTIEREWKHNARFVSCIPPGVYDLAAHSGTKFKNTFALISEANRIFQTEAECTRPTDRYAIVLHAGSWSDNFQGCIGAGYTRIGDGDRWGVGRTVDGIAWLLQYIRDEEIERLEIKNHIYYNQTNVLTY